MKEKLAYNVYFPLCLHDATQKELKEHHLFSYPGYCVPVDATQKELKAWKLGKGAGVSETSKDATQKELKAPGHRVLHRRLRLDATQKELKGSRLEARRMQVLRDATQKELKASSPVIFTLITSPLDATQKELKVLFDKDFD